MKAANLVQEKLFEQIHHRDEGNTHEVWDKGRGSPAKRNKIEIIHR